MKSKWGRIDWILLLLGLIPVVAAWAVYDRLPDSIVIHWNFNDEPNGFMSKTSGLLFLSLLLIGMPFLMKLFRRIDPRRENYEMFAMTYDTLRLAVTVLLGCVTGFTVLYNLGYDIAASRLVLILIGGIFMVMGNYMGRIRPNYFIGIRTPWTLASEEVWRRTHRFAGPIWFFGGLIALVCSFLPAAFTSIIAIVVIAATVIIPTVYSYLAFANEKKRR